MTGDYSQFQKWNTSKTTDVVLAAGDTVKANVIVVKSANHQLWIQKIFYSPVTAAAQAVTISDTTGTPVVIGVVPASQSTPFTLDYGPKGMALAAGKNLTITPAAAGPAGQIHIEAYEKIVSGAININSAVQ
jgi:microcystin degradation protein MlrC